MESKLKILFISRAYPPTVGGIENQNEAIGRWLGKISECRIIANRRGKRWLPIFIPLVIVKGLWFAREVNVVLLGDGVVTIVGWAIKMVYPKKRVVCIVHGLDITYDNRFYQVLWVRRFFKSVDHFVAVSRSTAELAMKYADLHDRVTIIPNGVDDPDMSLSYDRNDLSLLIGGKDIEGRIILLTIGRLVKRKGVTWFLRNVLSHLPDKFYYIIAGDGPERGEVISILESAEFSDKAKYLGRITEEEKQLLFTTSDIFIQPNIQVPGDAEGFGITVLEAGSYGLPVLSTDIEGLKDSVQNGHNGWTVPSSSPELFAQKLIAISTGNHITRELESDIPAYIHDNFSHERIASKYHDLLKEVCASS